MMGSGLFRYHREGEAPSEPAMTWIIAPMLADFTIRLAFGLAVSLLLTSWRVVPLGFFRTQAQVMLGLLVLAGLDHARAGGPAWALSALVAGAVIAYFAAVAWGLGLPRFGTAASVLVAVVSSAWLGGPLNRPPHRCGY